MSRSGSVTLLFQRAGETGLEILDSSSAWLPVPTNPQGTEDMPFPPILVNIGDILQFWTRRMLKSTVHRVTFPREGKSKNRYSIAYFCHPLNDIVIGGVPSKLVAERSLPQDSKFENITADEYLQQRLQATYDWGDSDKAMTNK